MSQRPWAAIVLAVAIVAPAALCTEAGGGEPYGGWIYDMFFTSPFQSDGGWWVVEGVDLDTGQFWYDAQDHALVSRVDSRLETLKLVRALPRALGGSDSFEFGALLLIESKDFHASPYAFFEISFGLINSETTGTDRPGLFDGGDDDTYDMVEWDFFPNISPVFGGPSVGPTIVGGRVGDAWYNNFAFNFGPATGLDDEIRQGLLPPTGLPFDTLLDVRVTHDAVRQLVYLKIWALTWHGWVELPIRVPPTDVSRVSPSFVVDRVAISLYKDALNPSEDDPSLAATVRYYGVYVVSGRLRQIWGQELKGSEGPEHRDDGYGYGMGG